MTRNYNWIWKGNVPSSTTFKTAPGSSSQALAMQNQPAYACMSKENHWLRSFLGHRYMAGGSTFQTRTRKPSGMPYLPSQKSLEKWVRPKKWVVAMDPLNTQKDTSLSLSPSLSIPFRIRVLYIYILFCVKPSNFAVPTCFRRFLDVFGAVYNGSSCQEMSPIF